MFLNSGIRAKATCRGGRPQPRSPTKGLPAMAWTARKSGRPRPARSQVVASLRQRLLTRGSRPWLACDRDCRRWDATYDQDIEAAALRGDACRHDARRQAACEQKLPPTKVATPAPWQRGCRRARQPPPTQGQPRRGRRSEGDGRARASF
ncbi:hypothetical protein BHE74_00052573 [Ensete ventricosum]|nr:hypothetical protein BHE74_00052573 [Ensete ventricosum]